MIRASLLPNNLNGYFRTLAATAVKTNSIPSQPQANSKVTGFALQKK